MRCLLKKSQPCPFDEWSARNPPASVLTLMVGSGGANVAKPLHVGHLRSAFLGESIKRIGRYIGHRVISDVHLGDWGLQMGMLIHELSQHSPELPYFDVTKMDAYPSEAPVSVADLDELYLGASKKAQVDAAFMADAKASLSLRRSR